MGIFDFVKNAGKKLWGSDDDDDASQAIAREAGVLGMTDALDVKVEGDKVVIKGTAPSQEAKEKLILAAGNVEGIAKVEEEIATADSGSESTYHTVEKGDTLWAIAQKAYGDGSKYNAIFEANKPMLSDPDKIYPGQLLRIPPLS
jgi:nucleoid-associated protein YgaU